MNQEQPKNKSEQVNSEELAEQTRRNMPVVTRTLEHLRDLQRERGQLAAEFREDLIAAQELIHDLLGEEKEEE